MPVTLFPAIGIKRNMISKYNAKRFTLFLAGFCSAMAAAAVGAESFAAIKPAAWFAAAVAGFAGWTNSDTRKSPRDPDKQL